MANNKEEKLNPKTIEDIKNLDSAVQKLLNDNSMALMGSPNTNDITKIHDEFTNLVRMDNFNFNKSKSDNINSFSYLVNAITGRKTARYAQSKNSNSKLEDMYGRLDLEKIFKNGDAQTTSMFINQSSDIFHICDEVESICAYLYQLDEAVNLLRDNILNSEQILSELPFDITFGDGLSEDNQEYVKIVQDVWRETDMARKLNDHIVPKSLKYGRYFVVTIPYSEIGVKMLVSDATNNRNIFRFGNNNLVGTHGVGESVEIPEDENLTSCMEGIDIVLDTLFENGHMYDDVLSELHVNDKGRYRETIQYNLKNLIVNDESTAPNFTGISESALGKMPEDLQQMVDRAMKSNMEKFNSGKVKSFRSKSEKTIAGDAVVDPNTLDDIDGCFVQLVDARQMVPIKIFDHTIGYYYFENFQTNQIGTSITDLLSNRVNFNDQNLLMDGIVGSVLRNLKYGELLKSNNDFKSLILNCIMYAEKRQDPVRIKFLPVDYVEEFKTNCDENGNGQPILLKSLVFGRLYVSMLMFMVTTVITKSTDTEFYYLKDGQLTQSYEDQVADVIEQFRNSNVDISQILNGNIMHGNSAINKRYFMCTGSQDIKPFDMEVISGQQIDVQNEFINNLKKMAIGSTGIPALAIDYMDETEFATILKMTNTKVMTRANNTQKDYNPSITSLSKKLVKYHKPNAIPEDILDTMQCTLRKNNTINNNIATDELNNAVGTAEQMVNVWYKGQNTENPQAVEFEKEELQKQLTILMSPSLPWSHIDTFKESVKINAIMTRYDNEEKNNQANGGGDTGSEM